MERLTEIFRKLEANGLAYNADDVIEGFIRDANEYSRFNFMKGITKFEQNGKVRTSKTYAEAPCSFRRVREDRDLALDDTDLDRMMAYETL